PAWRVRPATITSTSPASTASRGSSRSSSSRPPGTPSARDFHYSTVLTTAERWWFALHTRERRNRGPREVHPMQELIPLLCGLALGAGLGLLRPGIRLPVGALLSVAIGVFATFIT